MTPTLITDRLILRAPIADDFPAFADFARSPRAGFIGGLTDMDDKALGRAFGNVAGLWLIRGYSAFTACLKDGTPLGFMGPWYPIVWPEPEFGWSLWNGTHERKGYVTEAMRTLLPWTWNTVGLQSCVAYIDPGNAASIAVAKRLGGIRDHDAPTPPGGDGDLVFRFHPETST